MITCTGYCRPCMYNTLALLKYDENRSACSVADMTIICIDHIMDHMIRDVT